MATHTVKAGDTWKFETTLTDADGNGITSLTNAWFSIYSDQSTEVISKELSDAEVTLASNVLTTIIDPADTDDVDAGTYYLDVKIEQADGSESTVTFRDRVKVRNSSPLYDDH